MSKAGVNNKTNNSSLKASDFVHLHNHSHYSLLDGLQKVPEIIQRTKELGMDAVAITDHGTLSGVIQHYTEAKKADIKPLIGIETYIAARSHLDKEAQDKSRFHLNLIAMNNVGYENLMRLSTIANLDGYYYKPRIDHSLLERYQEGLICLSGCIGGEVGASLREGDTEKAKELAKWYKGVFGDRYYIEVQDHGHKWKEQDRVNKLLIKLAAELDIKVVVTADSHYLTHDDQEAHEALLCVQTGSFLSDQNRMSLKEVDLHLTDPKDIIKRWSKTPDLITNTKEVADRCDVTITLGEILIPNFPTPKGKSEEELLIEMIYQGLAWRYAKKSRRASSKLSVKDAKKLLSKEILERTKFELDTITKMGFAGYFLIVQDFINWGKQKGIMFGPGRGSAAGSIIAYALNITELDPLTYDLLFERFLNPDRISMPDIDIDIQDSRRDEVIAYCVEKYGQDKVAHIVTFGTMAARNAIRDVSRVKEVPYAEADRLAKLVPPPVQGRHIPLKVSIKDNPELRNEYESNADSREIIDLAIRLEGTIRSHGVHAAGVVIAPDDIVKYTPLEMAQKGVITTQYSMGPIEDLGLLKMDFLGLSNLTTIKNTLRIIKKVWGKNLDISTIPLNDSKTFELLGRGDTTGIFQFESGGMKRYLKRLKPTEFEDIIAMGALYRPGPLTAGLTDKFVARKNGEEEVSFEHELMKNALGSTYGVLVYQEQVMRIARDMCGFTGGQADTLRKAIGKKNIALMNKMKKEFIDGMVENSGVEKRFADKFWKDLEGFADYAFNKSHSACYGLISYQTAYLKAHYPEAFMAALMTSDFNDTDRLAIEINECRHMGIEVLPPDVNESYIEFGVVPETKQIRFGMAAVKNVGKGAVEEILRAREDGGPFASIEEFMTRVDSRVVNRKNIESLAKAGAFDKFRKRSELLHNMDRIISFGQKIRKESENGQIDLFGDALDDSFMPKLELDTLGEEIPEREVLAWERELLGIYLSKHPLDGYEELLEEQTMPINKLTLAMDGRKAKVGGVIQEIKEVTTKNGVKMAFVTIEDKTGELEAIVFPSAYSAQMDVWQRDNVVLASGKLNSKDRSGNDVEELKILIDEVARLTQEDVEAFKPTGKKVTVPRAKSSKQTVKPQPDQKKSIGAEKLYLHIKKPNDNELIQRLRNLLSNYSGSTETILVLGEKKNKRAIRLPFGVDITQKLRTELVELLDEEAVVTK